MLRIEEIVGAMDDEFRYALDALSDERLAQLAADKAALRRLRPVGVSHAEALEMIAAIQSRRQAKRQREEEASRRKAERAAKRKAAPPRRKKAAAQPAAPSPMPAALPAPPPSLRLAPPAATGPAIRLPPPASARAAIPLPPPAVPQRDTRWRPTRRMLAAALVVAALTALVVAVL